MSDLIHVKHKATEDLPLCRFNPGDSPMAWTGYLSARAMATCAECLQEVMQDECTLCEGTGISVRACGDPGCCGEVKCPACDLEAAEDLIEKRLVPPRTEEGKP